MFFKFVLFLTTLIFLTGCEGITTIHSDVIVIDSDVKPTVVVKEQKHV